LALPLSHYTCSGLMVKPIYLAKVCRGKGGHCPNYFGTIIFN